MSSQRMSMRPSSGESGLRLRPDNFISKLSSTASETLNKLLVIWKEAGYEDAECQSLLGDLLGKIKLTCITEIAAEEQILEHAKQEVASKIQEYYSLCAQLGRVPAEGCGSGNNYADKLAELEKLLSTIEIEVSERQKVLDVEFTAIESLVDRLGEQSPSLDIFAGPEGTPQLSDVRLQLLREHKESLFKMRDERIQEMKQLAEECSKSFSDLVVDQEGPKTLPDYELFADIDFAVLAFMRDGNFNIGVHTEDLAKLKDRCQSLTDEKERRRFELSTTGAEIARLWTLLRIPTSDREAFQSSFKMNLSAETLSKGKKELEGLREIRTTSLGRVVTSIRQDIAALWEEVGIDTDEQKGHEFPTFFYPLEELEDTTVEVHEAYFSALKTRVEELRPILLKISRREIVVQERVELEHIQCNPERLIARGPNAREDRKREEAMASRVKNIDKITKELLAQIAQWEDARGPFMFAGERYSERVLSQEESYIEIRDSLRNARKEKKDGKAGPETRPVSGVASSMRKAAAPQALNTSQSQKLPPKTVTIVAPVHEAPIAYYGEDENKRDAVRNRSMGSIETDFTSVTQLK